VDLGLEVESTFQTTKAIKWALENEPNRIKRLVSEGDNICNDLITVISQLEKSRKHLP
jgi:archaellum component FlaC